MRSPPSALLKRGAKVVTLDRDEHGALERALGAGADVLIDAVAYDDNHARQLLDVQSVLGSLIVVSSSSVYRDRRGRTLDEAAETGFPDLPNPIGEGDPTVDPGPQTYSTRKAALERALLDGAAISLTILRPVAVSGIGSAHAREWWFVKRICDRRPAILLAYSGRSRFHTTSVANIAALIRLATGLAGQHILNIADPEALPVSAIADEIALACGYPGRLIALPDVDVYPPPIGRTPWSVPHPFVLDMSAAIALGYRAETGYAATVGPICDWLIRATEGKDWRAVFPELASYPYDLFDYRAEDAWLATRH
jgi:nucleoside-diphosphate-sugar epimerase